MGSNQNINPKFNIEQALNLIKCSEDYKYFLSKYNLNDNFESKITWLIVCNYYTNIGIISNNFEDNKILLNKIMNIFDNIDIIKPKVKTNNKLSKSFDNYVKIITDRVWDGTFKGHSLNHIFVNTDANVDDIVNLFKCYNKAEIYYKEKNDKNN